MTPVGYSVQMALPELLISYKNHTDIIGDIKPLTFNEKQSTELYDDQEVDRVRVVGNSGSGAN